MTGGGPARATETISTVVYKVGFQGGDVPYATALATVMAIVVAVLATVQYRLTSKQVDR